MKLPALYTDLAEFYYLLSNDRDFNGQVEFIWRSLCSNQSNTEPPRVLELFAGPAFHSINFIKNYNATVRCVDASEAMKTIACRDGLIQSTDYIIVSLPELLEIADFTYFFDCVLILRYSIGYLEPEQLELLLFNLASIMKHGSPIVIELHLLNLLRQNLEKLQIRERTVSLENGKNLRCIWPNDSLIWGDDDWSVQMPVLLEIFEGEKKLEEYHLISPEHIYVANDFRRLANRTNCFSFEDVSFQARTVFSESKLVVLRRR